MDTESLDLIKQMPPAAWACMIVGGLFFWAAFWSVFCVLFQRNLTAIPAAHRRVRTWQIWLLIAFPFSIVWMFFVLPRLSDSWRSWLQARGDASVGQCGRKVGLWCAAMSLVSNLASILPYLGDSAALGIISLILSSVTGLAGFILLIAFCVIINDLRLKTVSATG